MKHVVMATGLHEADIRPSALLSEFKRLSVIDAGSFFSDPAALVEVACPACDSKDARGAFRMNEFLYNECRACGSLFVSPRPSKEALVAYYENSKASHYRVEHLARATAPARREHLLRTHANWLGRMVDEAGNPTARTYADVSTQSVQIFDEIRGLGLFDVLYSLHPLSSLDAECEAAGAQVAREPLTDLGAATAFGLLENRFCPLDFLDWIGGMLAEGGVFTFTTRTVSGFDLQVLWDKIPYIFVPEHLNLLSIEGIEQLIERSGLELLELSTPGQLDLELTSHAVDHDPSIALPLFVEYLLKHRKEAHADFQEFLQKHRLSSHVRVAVAKPKAPAS